MTKTKRPMRRTKRQISQTRRIGGAARETEEERLIRIEQQNIRAAQYAQKIKEYREAHPNWEIELKKTQKNKENRERMKNEERRRKLMLNYGAEQQNIGRGPRTTVNLQQVQQNRPPIPSANAERANAARANAERRANASRANAERRANASRANEARTNTSRANAWRSNAERRANAARANA